MTIFRCVGCFYFHIPEGICFAGITCTWLPFARFHLCFFVVLFSSLILLYLLRVFVCLPFLVVCHFLTVPSRARHWSLSWVSWIQSTLSHSVSLRPNLTLRHLHTHFAVFSSMQRNCQRPSFSVTFVTCWLMSNCHPHALPTNRRTTSCWLSETACQIYLQLLSVYGGHSVCMQPEDAPYLFTDIRGTIRVPGFLDFVHRPEF
jgi:hypothetical protein